MTLLEVEAVGEGFDWTGLRRYEPKAGLDATLAGSVGYGPRGRTFDIAAAIARGYMVTSNPYLQLAIEDTGLFDLVG